MPDLYPIVRPVLWRLPTEWAHKIALYALRARLGYVITTKRARVERPPNLRQQIWGLTFPNPIGVAAGFDKDAVAPDAILRLGFGSIEIGTVTPTKQRGNPGRRLFRLDRDSAIINRMGFPSGGLDPVVKRLSRRSRRLGILGVNLGKNRDTVDAAADYIQGITRTVALADYLVVNISSPNTPGLRDLQRREPLEALLKKVLSARDSGQKRPPLLVKIAPDLSEQEQADIAAVALSTGIDGIIIANTTVTRPEGLSSGLAQEQGGLSGPPLFQRSTELLSAMYRLTNGSIPLIGVGGVTSAEDAYAKIRAGASLVQLHTALIFQGMNLIEGIKAGLADCLRMDGYTHVSQAVGADHPAIHKGGRVAPTAKRGGEITGSARGTALRAYPDIARKGQFSPLRTRA